jgi:two-component system, response regulator YesN
VDQNRYAIIINTAEQSLVAAAVNAVRADYAAGEGIRSIIGIGNPFEGLPHIGKSYREALCAVNYCANLESPPNGTVYYKDIETNRTLGYRIPKDVEDELQKLLRAGDSQALKSYLDPFMEQSVRRVGAGPVSVQVFFYSLLSIALKAAANGELPMSSLIDEQRLMTMNSTAEVKSYISNVYMLVCESLHTEKHGHCQKIRTDILNFIDDNCLDDKLTLQSLADIFGVSVPYLSKFVKDQTGRNFLDYIAQKRVTIAKEMLRTGKYSIQQVGEQVGYANALTFRRVFKKIEGVNPGDYRDSIGNAG